MKKASKKMSRTRGAIDVTHIRSLTEFQRNTKQAIREMKRTGQPQVLTVKGKAELVVQDAAAYQKLLNELDHSATLRALDTAIEAFERGEGYPIERALDRIRRKYGISRRNSSRR